MSPAAGWYADPGVAGRLRWWDGTRWTEHVTPDPNATSVREPAPSVADAVTEEQVETSRPAAVSGWYADPSGVAGQLRWWDGTRWTAEVAEDPSHAGTPASTEVAPEPGREPELAPERGPGPTTGPTLESEPVPEREVEPTPEPTPERELEPGREPEPEPEPEPTPEPGEEAELASAPGAQAPDQHTDAGGPGAADGRGPSDIEGGTEPGAEPEPDPEATEPVAPGRTDAEPDAPDGTGTEPAGDVGAGWYPDPSGVPDQLRWWDGGTWTDTVRPDPLATSGPRPEAPDVGSVPGPAQETGATTPDDRRDEADADEALAAIEAVTQRSSVLDPDDAGTLAESPEGDATRAEAQDPAGIGDRQDPDGSASAEAAPEDADRTAEPGAGAVGLATAPGDVDAGDGAAEVDAAEVAAADLDAGDGPSDAGTPVTGRRERRRAARAASAEAMDPPASTGRIRTRTIVLTVLGVVAVGIAAASLTSGDGGESPPPGTAQPGTDPTTDPDPVPDPPAGETPGDDPVGGEIEIGATMEAVVPEEGTFEIDVVVPAGGEVTIDVRAVGEEWDPVAELTDLDGVTVAYNDDRGETAVDRVGGGYYDPLIVTDLEEGTYRLIVRGFAQESGPFELRTS